LELVNFHNEISLLLFKEGEPILTELSAFGTRILEVLNLAWQLRNLLEIRLHLIITLLNEVLRGWQLCLEIHRRVASSDSTRCSASGKVPCRDGRFALVESQAPMRLVPAWRSNRGVPVGSQIEDKHSR
jgi:hypothetical protein